MLRRFTIGRDRTCDVPIADDSVSRLHAEVWMAEDGAIIMADRGSSNGTTLLRGGQSFPLRQDVVLPGDQVRFGGVLLSVKDIVEAVEARTPGALTPKSAQPVAQHAGPARPASPQHPQPPPAVSPHPAPPPPITPAPSPGFAGSALPPRPAGILVRCDCGAIKTLGQLCPGCHR